MTDNRQRKLRLIDSVKKPNVKNLSKGSKDFEIHIFFTMFKRIVKNLLVPWLIIRHPKGRPSCSRHRTCLLLLLILQWSVSPTQEK